MFFGLLNKARNNKENILYAIVTIVLLERVRTGWNKIESRGRREERPPAEVQKRQWQFTVKAALLYALPLLLPLVKYIYRSIDELSWSVQGLVVLKSTPAFFVILVLTECFLAVVIYNLLKIYIERMNAAIGFFTKIGRNIWDGSKLAVQFGGDVGSRMVGGVRSLSSSAKVTASTTWTRTKKTSKRSIAAVWRIPRMTRRIRLKTLVKSHRRTQSLEGTRS